MGQRTAAVVHRVTRTDQPDVSDRELLRRFAAGDQAAFTGLVRRHMPMVLGVCRRALGNAQDAEDACQATFLVLSRKARTGRWQPSIANWLYATARRVARNARVAADRRARREGRAARSESVAPLDQMTGRDLLAVLDEELDRLPPRYREPLVLCYLQGLTRDEAAARLGVPSVTLKSQLDRGRKRLAAALTRRGIAFGAGLVALAASARAESSGSRLLEAVQSAAAGKAPSAVIVLAEGATASGLAKNGMLGGALAAAVAITGLGLGEPRASTADPPDKAMPAKAALKAEPIAKPAPEKPIPVSGRVLDPDGKPVAGASFAIIDDETGAPVPKIVSGADGRFAFDLPYPPTVRNPRQVVASAPGLGLDWLSEPRADAVFRLVPDQPITGKVVDLQGKPVAGATVAVHNVHVGPAGAFDELLKNWSKSAEDLERTAGKLDRTIWNRGGLGQAFHTRTAADGTFTLSGLGRDRAVTLLVTGPGLADTFADVATRKGVDLSDAGPAARRMRASGRGSSVRLYAPEFSLVVGPDKPIAGVVRDGPTGTPLSGVRVTGASLTGDIGQGRLNFHAWPTPSTRTDKDGKFTLRGLAKARAYVVVADPEEGTEHLHRFDQVEDTVGFDPIATGFSLPRGVILTGRVTDAKTGQGVASRVFYRPLENNDQLYGGYGPPDYPAPWHHGRDTKTDMQGRYKITVAPGAGVVNFQAYGGSYQRAKATQKEIDDGIVDKQFGHFRTLGQGGMFNPEYMHEYRVIRPAAADRKATLDVTYQPEAPTKESPKAAPKPAERPGRTYSGRVVGPDDKPVAGATVFALGSEDATPKSETVRTSSGPDRRFRITLPDGQRFATGLFARSTGFGIGRVEPKGDTADDLTIRLVADNPVSGRVVTTEGKTVAGVRLTIDRIADDVGDLDNLLAQVKSGEAREGIGHRRSMPTAREELGTTVVTGADGKFRLAGGGKDRILYVDVRGDGIVTTRLTIINRPGFDPEPFNAAFRKAGDRFEARSVLHGPDLNIVAEREKLIRGRVTDAATGEPRAGVHVLLTRSPSDLLLPIPDAWTDKDGRYEVRGARKARGYMVEVPADTAVGYVPCQGWADDTSGYEPVTIDLRVKKGVVITGRLIDKETGKPVSGWALIGVPQGNPSVKDYPEFNSSAWFPLQQTDAEGRFRVVAIPGPVLLMGGPNTWDDMNKYKPPKADAKYPQFFQTFGDHTAYVMAGGLISPLQGRSCKVLEIKADAKAVEQDIELEPVEPPKKVDPPATKP
ncbi:MAG TPA: sigma-70 family RNA polymerase sigma factor [Gemmataceae bacterium]|nr:sigma-70 family RNA polymerase sigma factor [Gemmataceae bacterium]